MKKLIALCLAVVMLAVPLPALAADVTLLSRADTQSAFSASRKSVSATYTALDGTQLPYRLFVPADYDPAESYPLVMFFHGSGQRGTANDQLSGPSFVQRLLLSAEQSAHPCLILVPQCGLDGRWVESDWTPGTYDHTTFAKGKYITAAEELIDKVINDYSVDATSLYVTGLSMGGFATWDKPISSTGVPM